jgi:hypothetical protein
LTEEVGIVENHGLGGIIMKKLFVLTAIAALAACGGSDNKPATDPSTTTSSTATPGGTSTAAPSGTGTAAPGTTGTTAPTDATKK